MIVKTHVWIALSTIALVSVFGCADKEESEKANNKGTMERLADDAVFMRVNGQSFTKHDYLVASSLFDKMHRMRAGDPLTGPNPKAERATELRSEYTVSEIQRRALMAQFAKENKVEASDKNVKEAESRFLKVVGREKKKIEDVIAEYGAEDGALLKEYLKGDAVDLTLREYFDKEKRLQITDADIMAVSNRIQQSVAFAAESNKLEKAILNAAIVAIKNGLPFEEAAKKYSLLPEEGVEWEDFESDDLADLKELGQWAKTAKVGDVSGVLELEDGFSVVKLLAHEKEDEDETEKQPALVINNGKEEVEKDDDPPEETWTMVRICRKAWDPFETMTRQEIIDGLTKARSKEIQKKIGDAIMAKAVIEWPQGTNLFNIVVGKKKPGSSK